MSVIYKFSSRKIEIENLIRKVRKSEERKVKNIGKIFPTLSTISEGSYEVFRPINTVGKNENFALTQMSQNPQKLAQISYF